MRWPPQSRSVSHLEVERKFLPASDFCRRFESLRNFGERRSPSSPVWSASKTQRIRDTYFDYHDVLASKGIWIRYRYKTSTETKDAQSTTDPPADGCWDAKVRLGGDFIESQFEEHQGEPSIRKLLSEHVPGTMFGDLEITADLETTRTTWDVRLRDRYLSIDQAPCSNGDYLTVALDHVVSLKEKRIDGQPTATFEHVVGEIELTKRVNARPEDGDFAKERKMELDRMKAQIEDFMMYNPGLFSQSMPTGKLSAYFDWKSRELAGAAQR